MHHPGGEDPIREGRRGARARFLDSGALRDIDVSLVDAKKGSYVEVFADHAISSLSREEAERKAELLVQVLREIRE